MLIRLALRYDLQYVGQQGCACGALNSLPAFGRTHIPAEMGDDNVISGV